MRRKDYSIIAGVLGLPRDIRRIDAGFFRSRFIRSSDGHRKANHRKRKTLGGRKKKIRVAALLAHGELCRGCGRTCNDKPTDVNCLEIADFEDVYSTWKLAECPRQYVADIVDAVNLSQLADSHLPVSGGMLDQSAWWLSCFMALKSDMNQIENDKIDRERRRHG